MLRSCRSLVTLCLAVSSASTLRAANSPPTLTRTLPVTRTISVLAGHTVVFSARGSDSDGNLSGTEWYGHGDNPYVQYVGDVGGNGSGATFQRTHTFNNRGRFAITVVAFDTGSIYSQQVEWIVHVIRRGLYVDGFAQILGDPVRETALLEYAQANGFYYLVLYELHLLWNEQEALARFIAKAKGSYGIGQIGATGENEGFFDDAAAFHDSHPGAGFDVLNLEYEYWNHDPRDFDRFKELLEYMRIIAEPRGMLVEAYVGWPTEQECSEIRDLVDRLLLHAYRQSPDTAYGYMRERLSWLASLQDPLEIWPIFSAEACFMGPWLKCHPLSEAEETVLDDYEDETDPWKDGVALSGFQYFPYSLMPPTTVHVDGNNGTGEEDGTVRYPYDTIQEGVDAVGYGGTVKVAQGTYTENLTITCKTITIQGGYIGGTDYATAAGDFDDANRAPDPSTNNTWIDGDGIPIKCQGGGTGSLLSGFTLRNTGANLAGSIRLSRVIAKSGQ